PRRRPRDEPRQRDRRRRRGRPRAGGLPAAPARHRPGDVDPADHRRQHAADEGDGALPHHHPPGRGPARLDRRSDARHRSGIRGLVQGQRAACGADLRHRRRDRGRRRRALAAPPPDARRGAVGTEAQFPALNDLLAAAVPTMTLEFHCATDTGRARSNNEDSAVLDEATSLVVLADGMGGYNAGEVASGMCTSFIKTELGRWLAEASESATDTDVRRAMDICVDNANRAIFNAANSNPQYAGMGTTLVVGVFRDNRLLLGHVGDSRCYRQRSGRLVQITHDHSLLQEQIDSGLITAEQAAFSANKNLVTRAVGVEDTVLLETHLHDVLPGDLYLLCSDGLSDMIDDETISQLLQSCELLPEAGNAIIDAANEAGGKDNISVVLVRVRGPAGAARSWWPFRR